MSQDDAIDLAGRRAALEQRVFQDRAAALDRLVRLAAQLLRAPAAYILMELAEQPIVVSSIGLPDLSPGQAAPLPFSAAYNQPVAAAPWLINDTSVVTAGWAEPAPSELGFMAYAGTPLIASSGYQVGTLCVADTTPRDWTSADSANLRDIADLIMQSVNERADLLAQAEASAAIEQAHAGLEQRLRDTTNKLTDARQRLSAEVAERRALAYALVETQKRESLGVVASGIAHNFNNLLSTILGNAEMALLELTPESPAHTSIMPITIAAQRAATLTRQLLMYAGQGTFMVQPLDLNQVVADMTSLLGASVARRATLTTDLAPEIPAIVADATQVRQAITNLVTNAVEAIGEANGTIRVSTGMHELDQATLSTTYHALDLPAGTYVSVAVSDDGCGMDAATSARIFDPFFTTKFTGRGLGLAAVLGIVRGLRGAISVASTPGRGSTIRMVFPATTDTKYSQLG